MAAVAGVLLDHVHDDVADLGRLAMDVDDGVEVGAFEHLAGVGHLAARVGRPRAARAVGTVMNRNPIPIVLPCHRVIGADGELTGFGSGLPVKQFLLQLEGALPEKSGLF